MGFLVTSSQVFWFSYQRSIPLVLILVSVMPAFLVSTSSDPHQAQNDAKNPDDEFVITGADVMSFIVQKDKEISSKMDTINSAMSERMNALQVQINAVNQKLDDQVKETTIEIKGSIESFEDKIRRLSDEISSIPAASHSLHDDATISKLKNRVDELEKGMAHLGQDITVLDGHFFTALSDLNALQDRVAEKEGIREWPAGVYSLLMPRTGCPNDLAFVDKPESHGRIHTESSRDKMSKNKDAFSSIFLSSTIQQTAQGNFMKLRFCEAEGKSDGVQWPGGSYCILKQFKETCPGGMQEGHVRIDDEDDVALSSAEGNTMFMGRNPELHFCCMTSGSATTPAALPTTSPFLLFRQGGVCQTVQDMDVSEETLQFDTEDFGNIDKFYDKVPDVEKSRSKPLTFHLCYYVHHL